MSKFNKGIGEGRLECNQNTKGARKLTNCVLSMYLELKKLLPHHKHLIYSRNTV